MNIVTIGLTQPGVWRFLAAWIRRPEAVSHKRHGHGPVFLGRRLLAPYSGTRTNRDLRKWSFVTRSRTHVLDVVGLVSGEEALAEVLGGEAVSATNGRRRWTYSW